MVYPSLWPTFGAFLLLLFSCISGSAWSEISFLNVQIDGRNLYFGVFGYTGITRPTCGYNFSEAVGPINKGIDDDLGSAWLQRFEMVLIIHLLASILTLLAWTITFWRRDVGKKASFLRIVKKKCFQLAAVGTSFVWVWDLSLFANLRNEFRNNGIPADLGDAHWITLGAVIGLLIEPLWSVLEPRLPEAWQRRGVQPSVTNAGIDGLGAATTDLEKGPSVSENAATDLPANSPVVRDIPLTAKPPETRPRDDLENHSATSQTIQNPSPPSQPKPSSVPSKPLPSTPAGAPLESPAETPRANPSTMSQTTPSDDSENASLTSHEDEHTPTLRRQYSLYLPSRTSQTNPSATLRRVLQRQNSLYLPPSRSQTDPSLTSQTTSHDVAENNTPMFPVSHTPTSQINPSTSHMPPGASSA